MTDTTNEPKFDVSVELELHGSGGNAFAILGQVRRALKRAGASDADCTAFFDEATAGDYNHLLATVYKWVHVL